MMLIVSYPTVAETRAAAAAGHPGAQAELPTVDRMEARWVRAKELELKPTDELPDLRGRKVRILWDYESDADGESWTILRTGRRVLWRELAYWEGFHRFEEVFAILHDRYGDCLGEVRPTLAAQLYLYGDQLGSPAAVDSLNASLRRGG